MMGLTPRQSELLEFIRSTWTKSGRAPLIHEMMDHQDTRSINSIQRRLRALEERGFIRRRGEHGGHRWEVCE